MRGNVLRDVFMPFLLVTYVDEPVIDTHLELCRRFVTASLFFIELLETLQS
jgi:hypothetical protein